MPGRVVILGAKGRFGRAAIDAFLEGGWQVRAKARNWPADAALDRRVEVIEGDAFDPSAVIAASQSCDVIVNALNPPYARWTKDLPRLTASVIAAAKASGATVMIPGNVYNYGAAMPEVLTEDTPHAPTTRKGRLREQMEDAYAIAADEGVKTIILRGGDFIEREKTGNWFDTYIANKVSKGRVTYPGPRHLVHGWAYLPDMARAMVGLAEQRSMFAMFETFGLEGLSLTGDELIEAMQRTSGRDLKVCTLPWTVMGALGLFVPAIREVMEMRYLWTTPHRIDGAKLARVLPEFRATPLASVLADALQGQTEPNVTRAATA